MRRTLVVSALSALIALWAAPAFAKGPDVRVSTQAVITGTGLKGPIVIQGDVSAYGFDGSEAPHNELTDELLLYSGLSDQDVGWYELPPDPATLGSGYEITYTFMGKGSDQSVEVPLFGAGAKIDLSVPFRQILYPYAPERPLVYTAPGQFFLSRMMGQWWSAPPALRTYLISLGLPSEPVVAPAPAEPGTTPEPPAREGYSWAIAFAVTGLLAMVVTAALAGRSAQVRRNRLSA